MSTFLNVLFWILHIHVFEILSHSVDIAGDRNDLFFDCCWSIYSTNSKVLMFLRRFSEVKNSTKLVPCQRTQHICVLNLKLILNWNSQFDWLFFNSFNVHIFESNLIVLNFGHPHLWNRIPFRVYLRKPYFFGVVDQLYSTNSKTLTFLSRFPEVKDLTKLVHCQGTQHSISNLKLNLVASFE